MIKVREIFASIQSEGPFTGHPAVFIRLVGCNLSCAFCDTDHDSVCWEMTEEEILEGVRIRIAEECSPEHVLVVVTGGEPFFQDIGVLLHTLQIAGFFVQIETNGTVPPRSTTGLKKAYIVCSPKEERAISHDLLPFISAWKFLIAEGDNLPQPVLRKSRDKIYLQPLDTQDSEQNKRNAQHAVALCKKHGVLLSVQIHKILEIP